MDKCNCMIFEVSAALKINVVTPRSLVSDYQCFREIYCLCLCFNTKKEFGKAKGVPVLVEEWMYSSSHT